ncbi:hypothetical protein TWF481_009865 [Arthrobotrys musiformis]|uniref:Uncharacterized protein n=1 Tax=Arthrobotrys musiformis TaxID=47236 RepID=A0AAV9W711_9PEZI
MSRRPPPQDHSASSNDVPTVTSPVNSSYPTGILRPPPANRAISEPYGGYDVPASSTTPGARPLRSILTNPIPPPSAPRVRFLIPQSSTEIRDRLAGREGLVDSPGSTASTTSRDGAYSDSDQEAEEQQSKQPRRQSSQEPRDLSDIIGRSVRGFVRRNFDRNTRNQEQERDRDPNRGSISRGVEEQPYRTRNNGSPAQSDTSSVITSPELRRASLANTTGRNSPLQRFGARSINEPRTVSSRASIVDPAAPEPKPSKPEDLSKAPPPQTQSRPLAESGRPRPGSPIRRKSSGHEIYHGPGQADLYYYGTPAAEQEPGVYYGPPPSKMPTPPPPPAMIPPKYKPGGGSAAEFYNPDNVDPDAAIPIQEGSQYELTITTGGANQPVPGPQAPQPQPGSFFGGPITAEPTSSLPGGFPETPINTSAPTSFSTAHTNPSYPPQTQVQLSYAPPTNAGTPLATVNPTGGATVTTGTMSVIDAATLAEMAYDQSLANQQRPTSTSNPSQIAPNLANLPPLPPSTAPTYASPYAPPPQAINTNVQTAIPPRPLTTMSPVPIQSPVLVAPRPQHSSNMVPAIAAAAVAGGVIGAAAHASHSHSASISSQTSYSQSSQSYIPAPPSHQPPPPPPLAAVTSPTTGKPKPPPKPAKPLLLTGIFGGKRPSISSPVVSQTGSSVGGKIIASGLVGAAAATVLAGQSGVSAPSKPSNLPPLITNPVIKPSSSSHHGKTAAIVAGTTALTVAAVASHKKDKEKEKEKEKQKISNKPSVTSSSSGDVARIHGLKGKANYNKRSNDIRGVKLPSAINAFDSASSSDFLFDSESDSSSSSSSHGRRKKNKGKHEKKGKSRAIEDLSSSHSSMDFGDDTRRSRGNGKSYGAIGAATTAAISIPGVVSDLNHSEDEGSSPRNRPGSHMRKKSTDSDLAFGRSVGSNVSGYTSDSSMYSSKQSPEAGNGFQFWAVRNRSGRRKARRVSSRDSINSANSALGFGDSSDESKPGSKGWLRKRESLDSNLAFGLSSNNTSRRSSYASGLHDKFNNIEEGEEDDDDYDNNRRRDQFESPTMVKAALETAAAYSAAEAARRKGHDRRPSEGIIVAPGHRLITEEQRMADYERLDRMRTEELRKDIARQKEAARLSELENDRKEKEKFDRERMERRRKEEEFRREKQWMIEEEERRGSIQRQVTPFYYYKF